MTAQDGGREGRISMERRVRQLFPGRDGDCQLDGGSKGALDVAIPADTSAKGRTFPVDTKATLRRSHQ